MNLWRRSKSWFQESFPSQKEGFEPQDYLDQEKQLLKAKYDQERLIIEKQFHYQMLEAKLRFENNLRHLHDEHSRLKARNNKEYENTGIENICVCDSPTIEQSEKTSTKESVKNSPAKNLVENGSDGLEWDPINELKSYTENETLDSWESQCEITSDESFGREDIDSSKFRDSAYGSISKELQKNSSDNGEPLTLKKFKTSDVERKIEQLRSNIRQEITREYDEKFQAERKFLYSVIDELEENVALLRKQKEDIVTIFEGKKCLIEG